MRICVIFNPTARGDKARRFRRHLDRIAAESALKQTTAMGDARRLAAEAVREGFETIVAAGGDGTLNEVLNGIGDAPEGFERARLALLPLGTVNVFAREQKLPMRLERAWHVVRQGREIRIDLPVLEHAGEGGVVRRHFAQLAGAGLDARAIELVDWNLKRKLGPLAYVIAGLRALKQSQSRITLTNGGDTATGELILIGNGRLYGGPFAMFPRAELGDGRLDVCVLPRVNWLTLLRCAPALLLRGRLPAGVTQNFQTESFTLASSPPAALETDGELAGHLPAKFFVRRSALRVIVP